MSDLWPDLVGQIRAEAHRLGFDLVGITGVTSPASVDRYQAWLEDGFHGGMDYLARADAVAKRQDLRRILPDVCSVIAVGVNYHSGPLPPQTCQDPSRGLVASYAWGPDYHELLLPRLRQLGAFLEAQTGRGIAYRAYVDTGPILERALSAQAGLGFVGRNTHLIHPRLGSWLLLGELLLNLELPAEECPPAPGTCGRCTRCLDACPTGAFVAPYTLDARRCISYLTIELKGPIPRDLRRRLGNRIFGCDVCQEVCPWNRRFARPTTEPAFEPGPEATAPHLLDLMALDGEGFQRRFQGSAIRRAKRRGLLRNVAVALGNWGDAEAVPALVQALHDAEPLIRGHAAWALGQIGTGQGLRALEKALQQEPDAWVQDEIEASLAGA